MSGRRAMVLAAGGDRSVPRSIALLSAPLVVAIFGGCQPGVISGPRGGSATAGADGAGGPPTTTPTAGASGTGNTAVDGGAGNAAGAPSGMPLAGTSGTGKTASPFVPVPVTAYLTKVKTILTNVAPTASEIDAVRRDPTALRSLIKQWMSLPGYLQNRREFFEQAFQQKPAFRTAEEFPLPVDTQLLQNMDESFGRTVEAAVDAGKPFNTAIKSNQVMMTLPMMVYYAAVDVVSRGADSLSSTLPNDVNFTFENDLGVIPIADTLNPQSPHFMFWYDPTVQRVNNPETCLTGGRMVTSLPQVSISQNKTGILYSYLFNKSFQNRVNVKPSVRCFFPSPGFSAFTTDDYTTWRPVTVRQPRPGEATTRFWDLQTMRSGSELVLDQPHVGFFTTPEFLAQWSSNESNQSRVTINQTLIVALNRAFDGSTLATPGMNMAALDAQHAPAGGPCFACHQTLDPMRQFFVRDYNYYFTAQTDPALQKIDGWFDVAGVSVPGTSLVDLGTQLANHPEFALAWTEKLCAYANSSPCDHNDPELQRVAAVFTHSGLDWNTLVVELFSSPAVTYASPTTTATGTGETVSIARQYQICSNLSARLGVPDLCGLLPTTKVPGALSSLSAIARAIPGDAYARGAVVLPVVTTPGLVFRATMENFCAALAPYLVDNGNSRYRSTAVAAAVQDMASTLMGVAPGTEAPVVTILQGHYDGARNDGASPTTALQSTFVLACLAPATVGVGLSLEPAATPTSVGTGETAGSDGGAAAGSEAGAAPDCPNVVRGLFTSTCAASTCHAARALAGSLDLQSVDVYARLLGRGATGGPGVLIDPAGVPEDSVLYENLTAAPAFGARMPLGQPTVDATTLACVADWIRHGGN